MAKKKVTRKAAPKQPAKKTDKDSFTLQDAMGQLTIGILMAQELGLLYWIRLSTRSSAFCGYIGLKVSNRRFEIMCGNPKNLKPWINRSPSLVKAVYDSAKKTAEAEAQKELAEVEHKAAKLRAQAKGKGRQA